MMLVVPPLLKRGGGGGTRILEHDLVVHPCLGDARKVRQKGAARCCEDDWIPDYACLHKHSPITLKGNTRGCGWCCYCNSFGSCRLQVYSTAPANAMFLKNKKAGDNHDEPSEQMMMITIGERDGNEIFPVFCLISHENLCLARNETSATSLVYSSLIALPVVCYCRQYDTLFYSNVRRGATHIIADYC